MPDSGVGMFRAGGLAWLSLPFRWNLSHITAQECLGEPGAEALTGLPGRGCPWEVFHYYYDRLILAQS